MFEADESHWTLIWLEYYRSLGLLLSVRDMQCHSDAEGRHRRQTMDILARVAGCRARAADLTVPHAGPSHTAPSADPGESADDGQATHADKRQEVHKATHPAGATARVQTPAWLVLTRSGVVPHLLRDFLETVRVVYMNVHHTCLQSVI